VDDPFFCDDCGKELGHDDIQVAEGVPKIDVESFEMFAETTDVYQCRGCGMVIGFNSE
jgi:hypothetical protein